MADSTADADDLKKKKAAEKKIKPEPKDYIIGGIFFAIVIPIGLLICALAGSLVLEAAQTFVQYRDGESLSWTKGFLIFCGITAIAVVKGWKLLKDFLDF